MGLLKGKYKDPDTIVMTDEQYAAGQPADRALQGRDGAVLGIATSMEMFEKLKFEGARLAPDWHPFDVLNFVVTAWHLFQDWKVSDARDALSRTKRNYDRLPSEMQLILDVLSDLANGGKHYRLDPKSAAKRKVDTTHTGRSANWYSFFFHHEDMPGVSAGGSYFNVRLLRNITLRYFEWVFDDAVPAKAFPTEICESVAYCDIANRGPGPPPPLWSKP